MGPNPRAHLRLPRKREKKMKPLSKVLFPICLFVIVALVGCAQPAGPAAPAAQPTAAAAAPAAQPAAAATQAPAAAAATKPMKIALVVSTSVTDSGWDSTAYQGLMQAKEKYGAETSVAENAQTSQTEAIVRDYASRGYDLIVTNSFSYGDGVMKVAPDFPKSKFAVTTGIWKADNVSSFDPLQEDYFLGGCLDGLMSKSGKLGIIGGVKMPAMIRTANAIADGAKFCKPGIDVSTAYVGSWADPAKAKELALAQIASGVDVIDGSASVGYDGIVEAVKQAEKDSGKMVYTITDMVLKPDFPKQIMAAHTQDHGPMVMYYADQVAKGNFQGGIFRPGLKDGLIYLKMTDSVPADVQAKVKQVQQDIIDGKVKITERFTE
jgi:basic membrane protein A and related proteins